MFNKINLFLGLLFLCFLFTASATSFAGYDAPLHNAPIPAKVIKPNNKIFKPSMGKDGLKKDCYCLYERADQYFLELMLVKSCNQRGGRCYQRPEDVVDVMCYCCVDGYFISVNFKGCTIERSGICYAAQDALQTRCRHSGN